MFENLSTLIVEIDEATDIANIKLNRPEKANALTGNMIHEVTKVFNALRKDERINRVILTGEGKHFCAGADVAEMTTNAEAMSSEKLADMFEEVRLFSEQKRLVVGVHGACMGGGCGFLVPNAIVIASDKPEDKTRFRFPEAMIGVRPSTISPHVISRIGAENAKYYFAGCDVIGIDRAYEMCLIDEGCQGFDNLAGEANYLSHELFDENGKKKARLPHLGDDKYWDPKTRAGEKIHQLVDVVSAALLKDPINWDYIKQLTIADIADARKDAADNKWQWGYEGVGYAGNNLRILEVGLGNQLHSMSTILTAAEHADLVRCAETAGLKNIEIGNLGKEYRQNIAIELNTDPITRNTGALNTPNHIAFVTNEDDVIEAAASVSRVVFEVSSAENDLYKVKILGNEAWQAGIDCACAIITGIKDDPSTGQTVDVSTIVEKVQELLGDGVDQIILQDTNGTATPDDITALLKAIKKEKIALDKIGIQCRDQNGNGLAKVRAAIGGGITEIVTSIGGVNGSGKGITRDIATESVVTLLTESGIEHGYDRPKLRKLETDVRKLLSFPVEHTPDQQHTRA